LIVLTRDSSDSGCVTIDAKGQPRIHYEVSQKDSSHLMRGLDIAVRILVRISFIFELAFLLFISWTERAWMQHKMYRADRGWSCAYRHRSAGHLSPSAGTALLARAAIAVDEDTACLASFASIKLGFGGSYSCRRQHSKFGLQD
jgi:hypothetical protein